MKNNEEQLKWDIHTTGNEVLISDTSIKIKRFLEDLDRVKK